MKLKLAIIWTLLRSKKHMLITGGDMLHVITNYSEKEISKSGNAFYIHPKEKQ